MGLPPAALPVMVALSWGVAPSTTLVLLGVVAAVVEAAVTTKHSSVVVSELVP